MRDNIESMPVNERKNFENFPPTINPTGSIFAMQTGLQIYGAGEWLKEKRSGVATVR